MPHKDKTARLEKHAAYMRNKYHSDAAFRNAHKSRVAKCRKDRRARGRQIIAEFKANGCVLCGEKEPCCLSAHHIDSRTKEFNVAREQAHCSIKRLKDELSKCACVCENCHRKLHAKIISFDS